jgi:thymidylate synthase (FAD)
MGSDLSVVNAARVSFGKKSDWMPRVHNGEAKVLQHKDDKLIKYLAKHKHISPFGHAFATFHVKAPVFVARQLVKHKFLRWNEISRRYVDEDPEMYIPEYWRGRSADKKQGSEGKADTLVSPRYAYEAALGTYKQLLSDGVAAEMARMVLPQSMMTEWYWSGSLDAFADMCHLRCKSDTQLETQIVANYIDDKMQELFPVSWEALRAYEE